jgi:tetratricopeptide (TPR) repeat protein
MPNRKKVMIELASAYYGGNQLDSALAVNQRIESYWGDYYPAVYMSCRLLYEQEKPAKALECYYEKLYMLKKDEVLYRKALNDVVRIEWHEFKNYPKAEKAIKNLMESAPNNYDYNMLLMQFYNFTGKYDQARVQENYIMEGYKNGKLSNAHYDKGTMVMEQLDTATYQIEVFRYFQPQKKGDCTYVAFIFNRDTSRPLGKITACTKEEQFILSGYKAEVPLVLEMEVNYENFKNRFISLLFSTETDEAIPEER